MKRIQAYGISTTAYPNLSGHPVDHVFVVGDGGFNWPCFGRGCEVISSSHLVAEGKSSVGWIDLLNGTDAIHPTGLTNKVDGICHNVANRLIASANCSVAEAAGNLLVTLVYGKFGFNTDSFLERVRAFAVAHQKDSGDAVDTVVAALCGAIDSRHADELQQLRAYIEKRCADSQPLPVDRDILMAFMQDELQGFYAEFVATRERIFATLFDSADPSIFTCPATDDSKTMAFQKEYLSQLQKHLIDQMTGERFRAIFTTSPQDAFAHLLSKP
mgnify:CR=1 FL=1